MNDSKSKEYKMIRVCKEVHSELTEAKIIDRESYNDVIERLIKKKGK